MQEVAVGSAVVHGGRDDPIATVRGVALSPSSLEAKWLVLAVLDSRHVTAVPTATASVDGAGVVHVPFSRAQLLSAPAVTDAVDAAMSGRLHEALGLV